MLGGTARTAIATVGMSFLTNTAVGVLFQDYLKVPRWANVLWCVLFVGLAVPVASYALRSQPAQALQSGRASRLVRSAATFIALVPSTVGAGWMWHQSDTLANWPTELLRPDVHQAERICRYDTAPAIWGYADVTVAPGQDCEVETGQDR